MGVSPNCPFLPLLGPIGQQAKGAHNALRHHFSAGWLTRKAEKVFLNVWR